MCVDDGAGGGGGSPSPPQNQTTDPCVKTKEQVTTNEEVQKKVKELKEASKSKGEKGINIAFDGTPSDIIEGGDFFVDLGDAAGNKGGYHNHPPSAINMFSPTDILKLFTYAMNFSNGNINDAFFGMVGSDVCTACSGGYKFYNYIIRFNGTSRELAEATFRNWDRATLMKDYRERNRVLSKIDEFYDYPLNSLNNKGLEQLFFDTLKSMKLENKVILQRVEDDKVQNITLDENNTPTPTPCS